MRGTDVQQGGLFSYVSRESRVPASHPLRGIKALLDEALASMSADFASTASSDNSRRAPAIAPVMKGPVAPRGQLASASSRWKSRPCVTARTAPTRMTKSPKRSSGRRSFA